jgi:hypothetical protein
MKIFEGKSPTERNKIIAAMSLGALALLALAYTFGGMYFGGKTTTVSVKTSPTAATTISPNANTSPITNLPTQEEMDFQYGTTPVVYVGAPSAPDAGRNIFAFYEPPPPTPFSPTPLPTQTPYIEKTPVPTPPIPQLISFVTPQSVYSGSRQFLLEVNGDKFTPETRIIFNGNELPTTFVNPQRLTANIPTNFITGEGQRFIMTRTPDGKLYSNQISINVQAAPTPQFQYIGMLGRQKYNNDTAYFQEQGKPLPFRARLNDVVAGRFRLMSISSAEVVFEDVNLGFKHKLALYRPAPGQTSSTTNNSRIENNPNNFNPTNPTNPTYPVYNTEIPGIPNNIPRYNPSNSNIGPIQQQQQQKKVPQQSDEDDEDGDN